MKHPCLPPWIAAAASFDPGSAARTSQHEISLDETYGFKKK
jgi:hypothetical protein